jgi:serine/threonine-protein kinase HipA
MMPELIVLLGDDRIGRLTRDARGRVAFEYDEEWQGRRDAYPLSVSLPLTQRTYEGDVVAAYLWGLLPDNELILDRWAKRFHVSARNPFALLANVGEDCPGAVRFVASERVEAIVRAGTGTIDWLDARAIAVRLRALKKDVSAWREVDDAGQFSLGGAQPKTALYFDGKRWGVPSGRRPTTHILKPGSPDLDGHAENEHFCLELAREVGLPVARSRVIHFEHEPAVVVERYDRIRQGSAVIRVHQEDCCQALGVLPVDKYENTGGPGASAITTLLRERSRNPLEDVETFATALAFNWVIAGTDAHAKNYSILIGLGGHIRLAPLYDIASFLPYAATRTRKVKLAMKIGGKYRLHEIGRYQWTKLALEIGLAPEKLDAMIAQMCRELPDMAAAVRARAEKDGLKHRVLPNLTRAIQERARACAKLFDDLG